jgi:hypothetical protein
MQLSEVGLESKRQVLPVQQEDMAMGSWLSPVVSTIFIERFE